jgi:hypothetical protein
MNRQGDREREPVLVPVALQALSGVLSELIELGFFNLELTDLPYSFQAFTHQLSIAVCGSSPSYVVMLCACWCVCLQDILAWWCLSLPVSSSASNVLLGTVNMLFCFILSQGLAM